MSSNEKVKPSMAKKRRFTQIQESWLTDDQFKDWLSKRDEWTASCHHCNRDITIKYEGISALKNHKKTTTHIYKTKSLHMSQSMANFLNKDKDNDLEEAIVSELCLTYHTVYHHLSYRSMDCTVKLTKQLFHDSKICQTIHCGRTKMEILAKKILCPLSIQLNLSAIQGKVFSIASDASNKGNVKLFPIAIQYFDCNSGIKNFVLDFYEDPNESSEAIYNNIRKCLFENKLNINQLIAYSADNASVNYGKHQSVFKNLKDEINQIVKANCNCHILHNTSKYSLIQLPFDVENLILKIYSHFCISAKRVNELKSCYEFCDNDFETMKRHVVTRWLSLFPAINRLIENILPIKSYFIGIGTEECPPIIKEFVWSETYNGYTKCELFLYFAAHLMKVFHLTIKTFEEKSTNSTNLYD